MGLPNILSTSNHIRHRPRSANETTGDWCGNPLKALEIWTDDTNVWRCELPSVTVTPCSDMAHIDCHRLDDLGGDLYLMIFPDSPSNIGIDPDYLSKGRVDQLSTIILCKDGKWTLPDSDLRVTHVLCDQYIIDKKKALESPYRPLSQFEETTLISQLIIPQDYDGVATETNEETISNVTEGNVAKHMETTSSRDSIYISTSVADSIKPLGRIETITSTADPQTFTHALIMFSSTPQPRTASATTIMETLGNPQLTRNNGHFPNVQKENYAQTFPAGASIEITSTSTGSAPPTNLVTSYVPMQETQFVLEKNPSVDSMGNFPHVLAVSTNQPLPKVLVNTEMLPRNEHLGISTPSSPYEDVVWSPLPQSQENQSYKLSKMIVKPAKQRAVNRKLRNFPHPNNTGAATVRLSLIQNKRQWKSRKRMRMQRTKRPQANQMRNQYRKVGEKARTERKRGSYHNRNSSQRQIGRLM